MGRLPTGLDVDQAWTTLAELAADERVPVRLGTLDALSAFALREGGGDALMSRALEVTGQKNFLPSFPT